MDASFDIVYALIAGFVLDLLIGDPRWMPSPVVWIGKLVSGLETPLRKLFAKTDRGELVAGTVLVIVVCTVTFCIAWGLLILAGLANRWLRLALEAFMCYQALAVRDLKVESMRVCHALREGDLPEAREAVSMIVGRDTAALDASGITRAAVESVAENTSDGVVAPLFYLVIGGAPLGMLYKAISTMDSMVGYRNERYRRFGTAAARLDDVANWIPARLTGLLMVISAGIVGLDPRGAWRIWRRDRRNTCSPNAGQPESACAGALGIQLGGNASYFGQVVEKPTLGDAGRTVEPEDIARANRLMYATSALCLVLFAAVRLLATLPFARM